MDNTETSKIEEEIKRKEDLTLLHTNTILTFNTESYKKILDAYYSSQANFDKIVMTVFFGEIGYVIHTIKDKAFHLSFMITIIISACGVYYSVKRYDADMLALFSEKDKISAETKDFVGLSGYEADISFLENKINKLNKLSKRYLFYIKSFVFCSSITTVETVYFIKESSKNTGLILSTVLLCFFIAAMFYYGGGQNET